VEHRGAEVLGGAGAAVQASGAPGLGQVVGYPPAAVDVQALLTQDGDHQLVGLGHGPVRVFDESGPDRLPRRGVLLAALSRQAAHPSSP